MKFTKPVIRKSNKICFTKLQLYKFYNSIAAQSVSTEIPKRHNYF